MAFFDEIITALDIDSRTKTRPFIYLSPADGLVVEGFKKIISLSQVKIELLCTDKTKIMILGKNLSAKEISTSEISLLGEVDEVHFIRVKK